MYNRFSSTRKRSRGRTIIGRFHNEGFASASESDDFLSQDVEQLLSELSSSTSSEASSAEVAPNKEENEWVTIDWNQLVNETAEKSLADYEFRVSRKESILRRLDVDEPSPVEVVLIRNRVVYLKRDDLLRLQGSNVSGNKARKLYALNEIPASRFPDVVVSYGGPQSNAMVALAAIVHSKNIESQSSMKRLKRETSVGIVEAVTNSDNDITTRAGKKRFLYYTKKLPRFLRNQPSGNFFRAKSLGMEIKELSNEEYQDLFGSESGGRTVPPTGLPPPGSTSLWVPQGGACGVAIAGARRLANEIVAFWSEKGDGRPLSVCVPGGTCATAVLLHREIRRLLERPGGDMDICVVVVPCVGDDAYARRQMMSLVLETGDEGGGTEEDIPSVLVPNSDLHGEYFRFGEPHRAILDTYREMKVENGVDLDLLYGAPAWNLMLQHWRSEPKPSEDPPGNRFDVCRPLARREVMYVHSGGLEGVTSQLLRYKHKGLVESNEIQLPGTCSKKSKKNAKSGAK